MNMHPADIQQLYRQVEDAAPDERFAAFYQGSRDLIQRANAGEVDRIEVHDEIVRVANWLDQTARLDQGKFDAVCDLLGQVNGEPAAQVLPEQTSELEPPVDESEPEAPRAEMPSEAAEALAIWDEDLAAAEEKHRPLFFQRACIEVRGLVDRHSEPAAFAQVMDDLHAMARRHNINAEAAQTFMQTADFEADAGGATIVHDICEQWERKDPRDSWKHADEPPPVDSLDAYGAAPIVAPRIEITLPPLTLEDWRNRDLPEPDFIMGHWLSTTSRVLLTAATGLGKTNFGLALALRVAAGEDFLHWKARRQVRVLYIDGEMSRRLLRQRVLDEERRLGASPVTFYALSHEDIPGFRPLNTVEGQAWLDAFIDKLGGVDAVFFDNIMCLTVGDMKDPEPWQQTIPWALSLTKRSIGQIWIHHTGHDETRSYGDKSREWQMDTVAHLDRVERDDTDVSFKLSFKKARERTPATRQDFQDAKIALINDQWEGDVQTRRAEPQAVRPAIQKALEALLNVLASDQVQMLPGGRRAAHRDHWAAECNARGLIDLQGKASSARTLMNTYRKELVTANRIACEGDMQWLL